MKDSKITLEEIVEINDKALLIILYFTHIK